MHADEMVIRVQMDSEFMALLEALAQEINSLRERVEQLEGRPAAEPGLGRCSRCGELGATVPGYGTRLLHPDCARQD